MPGMDGGGVKMPGMVSGGVKKPGMGAGGKGGMAMPGMVPMPGLGGGGPMKMKKVYQITFEKYDADKSGTISVEEFKDMSYDLWVSRSIKQKKIALSRITSCGQQRKPILI